MYLTHTNTQAHPDTYTPHTSNTHSKCTEDTEPRVPTLYLKGRNTWDCSSEQAPQEQQEQAPPLKLQSPAYRCTATSFTYCQINYRTH